MRIWSQILVRFRRPRRTTNRHTLISRLATEHLEVRALLAADLVIEAEATSFDASHQEMLDAAEAIPMLIENGRIAASPLPGLPTPSNFEGIPIDPIVTEGFDQAIPSNDWWSSVHFPEFDDPFSAPLFAHPLTIQMTDRGISLSAQSTQTNFTTGSTTREFVTPFSPDLQIELFGSQKPNRFALDSYTDWSFTGKWQGVSTSPSTTVAQGSPLIWLKDVQFSDLKIRWDDAGTVATTDENIVYLTIGDDFYGVYAPDGTSWSVNGQAATINSSDMGNLTLALLPNQDASTRSVFKSAAGNPVIETHFSFARSSDPYSIKLNYDYTLERNDPSENTIVALYPHLARHTSDLNSISRNNYKSPRGEMQPVETNRVEAEIKARGILPMLPTTLTTEQTAMLRQLVVNEPVAHNPLGYISQFADPYWSGKAMLKLMQLSQIAELVGETEIQTGIQTAVKQTFHDWFDFNGNASDRHFAYNAKWDTLQAYPESFGSGQMLNDHHFHMGYFVHAAALLGMSDPVWISENQTMIDLIIQDVAQIDPDSNELPRFRNFDPMAGHSWAAGHGAFSRGNNQESSSEAMNFATGLMLWGEATQRPQTTMLGQTLYSLEAEAIAEYWFDKYGTTYPDSFDVESVGMVWGDGAAHATWFSSEVEMIKGINYLPFHGGSLYLSEMARDPQALLQETIELNGGELDVWQSLLGQYEALVSPDDAWAKYSVENQQLEEGQSAAYTYFWMATLANLGSPISDVRGDHPMSAVFSRGDMQTYAAHNAGTTPITVTFSDGVILNVDPGKHTSMTRSATEDPVDDSPNPPIDTPDDTASSDAGGPVLSINWPDPLVVMKADLTVHMFGYVTDPDEVASIEVALRHVESGTYWQPGNTFGTLQYHDAQIVDSAGHWRLTVSPILAGNYEMTAVATDALGNQSVQQTTFGVIGESQYDVELPPMDDAPALEDEPIVDNESVVENDPAVENNADEVTYGFGLIDSDGPNAYETTGFNQGEFVTNINFSHRATADPLVAPGNPNFWHAHDFFVNSSTDAFSTIESLMAVDGSDAAPSNNESVYWVPSLINQTTGEYVTPLDSSIAYYAIRKPFDPGKLEVMPTGLSVIAGAAMPNERQSVGIVAWNYIGTTERYDHLPIGDEWKDLPLQALIYFPQFWDGENLDSPNHKSHMAYGENYGGPSTHPHLLPSLELQIHYGHIPQDAELILASDFMTQDHPDYAPGWSMHADMIHLPWPEYDQNGQLYDGFERRVNDSLRFPLFAGTDGNAVRPIPTGVEQPFTPAPFLVAPVYPGDDYHSGTIVIPDSPPGESNSSDVEGPSLSIHWPDPQVVMQADVTVNMYGYVTDPSDVESIQVALKHVESGTYWQPENRFGALEYHDAKIVDSAGHWRLTAAPVLSGTYEMTAVAHDSLGNPSTAQTTFRVIGESQYDIEITPVVNDPVVDDPAINWQIIEEAGTIHLLVDPETGVAHLRDETGQIIPVRRFDNYWNGDVLQTRGTWQLVAATRDLQGNLRVLDASPDSSNRYAWKLNEQGEFIGEDLYTDANLLTAETHFEVDLNGDDAVGTAPVIEDDEEDVSPLDPPTDLVDDSGSSDIEGPSLSINWPDPLVVMQADVTVNMYGYVTDASDVASIQIALRHVESGTYWQPENRFGVLQYHDAKIVDSAGHWRLTVAPVLAGHYEMTAIATDSHGNQSTQQTSFGVIGESQYDIDINPIIDDESINDDETAMDEPTKNWQVIEGVGAIHLLIDPDTGVAHLRDETGQIITVQRFDSYWSGDVLQTRGTWQLVAATRDPQGNLRVLDTSPDSGNRYAWKLNEQGEFIGEDIYTHATLMNAETHFEIDLNGDHVIGPSENDTSITTIDPNPDSDIMEDGVKIRAMSFNVYYASLGAEWRIDGIAQTIADYTPDLASIQEMWGERDQILAAIEAKTGIDYEFSTGSNTWDGDILYRADRWKILDDGVVTYDGSRGMSYATLEHLQTGSKVSVYGMHPLAGVPEDYHLRNMEMVTQHMANNPYAAETPFLLLGDLNAAESLESMRLIRDGSIEAYGQTWTVPITFEDTFRIANGDAADGNTGFGVKIDYIYTEERENPAFRTIDASIRNDAPGGSDHYPVMAEIVLLTDDTP